MENFSYEENIKRIKEIVDNLQKGNGGFENSVEMFKEGMTLVKSCQKYLNESELIIKQVINNEEKDITSQFFQQDNL